MKKLNSIVIACALIAVFLPTLSFASDLEVYQGGGSDAKILLVLDASGSMLLEDKAGGGQVYSYDQTRMNTLYEALEAVLEDDVIFTNPDLAVGLSYFGGVTGSGIKFPAAPLSTLAADMGVPTTALNDEGEPLTVKDVILNMVDGIFPRESDIYTPSAIDLKGAGYYYEQSGVVSMKNVPSCDFLIEDQDWQLTNGAHPELWERNYTEINPSATGGSKWSESPNSANMPMSWMQVCPQRPTFPAGTTVNDKNGNAVNFTECKDITSDGSNGWDPDECKIGPSNKKLGIDTEPHPLWPEGGFPGEWSYCKPDEGPASKKLKEVYACDSTFFSLYNDTRDLYTPTVDALYEATRYFRGDKVFYGTRDHFPSWNETLGRYVDLPRLVTNYPTGDIRDDEGVLNPDYPESKTYIHGFPGNLEVLGTADKNIFTSSLYGPETLESGGLWGWRAANPLTYEDDDGLGGNAGPRRRYLPVAGVADDPDTEVDESVSSWTGADNHTLSNDIFRFDCDYRIGRSATLAPISNPESWLDQWSYLFNSFHGCNLVERENIGLPYVQSNDLSIIEANRKEDDDAKAMGNLINNNNATPIGPASPSNSLAMSNEYLNCSEVLVEQEYCTLSSGGGENLDTGPADSECPAEDISTTSHWERQCEFRYESAKSYVSPIGECSNSAIILITDGHPTANTVDNSNYSYGSISSVTNPALALDTIYPSNAREYDVPLDTPGLIRELAEISSCVPIFNSLTAMDSDPSDLNKVKHEINKSGVCAKELATYLANNSQRPDIAPTNGKVVVNTIGFQLADGDPSITFLDELATAGEGQYVTAGDKATLINAIKAMITKPSKDTADTASVAVSLDSNTLTSARDVYAPIFKSTGNNIWDANVKGYYLYAQPDSAEANMLIGLDPTENSSARSFWSDDSGFSGNKKVLAGGLNKAMMPTITYNSMLGMNSAGAPLAGDADVSADRRNWLYADHTDLLDVRTIYAENEDWSVSKWTKLENVSTGDLGLNDGAEARRKSILDYTFGQPLGDSLHSKPISIEYNNNKYLVVVSNTGFLHSFKLEPNMVGDEIDYHTNPPTELMAWIPHSLLTNLKKQYNNGSNSDHVYGLDGPVRVWNPTVTEAGVEIKKTFIYFGLRRGGKSYYMLDMTNPEYPTVVWRIDAGADEVGFTKLGETWSPLTIVKVNDTDSEITLPNASGIDAAVTLDDTYVAVFGGGYNTNTEDVITNPRSQTASKSGRGLYVINPLTGELLRSFGKGAAPFSENIQQMTYGVPAEIRAIDADGNGYGDRLYFGDMGGQLWRIDIDASNALTSADGYNVKLLADFGVNLESSIATGEDTETVLNDDQRNHRRFYTTPALSFMQDGNLAIAIGSGYRGHPLQGVPSADATSPAIEDRFYVLKDSSMGLKDPSIETPPYVDVDNAVTEVNLSDVTTDLTGSLDLSSTQGWYIKLNESGAHIGEKVLSSPVIFRNTISFTTTTPRGTGEACVYTPTLNRFYSINMYDGTPSGLLTEPELDADGELIPITDARSVDIITDDAIVDEVQVVTMDAESASYSDVNGSSGSDGSENDDNEICAKVFAKQNEMLKMCYAPTKVFWKETGRDEIDCRFDDADC